MNITEIASDVNMLKVNYKSMLQSSTTDEESIVKLLTPLMSKYGISKEEVLRVAQGRVSAEELGCMFCKKKKVLSRPSLHPILNL